MSLVIIPDPHAKGITSAQLKRELGFGDVVEVRAAKYGDHGFFGMWVWDGSKLLSSGSVHTRGKVGVAWGKAFPGYRITSVKVVSHGTKKNPHRRYVAVGKASASKLGKQAKSGYSVQRASYFRKTGKKSADRGYGYSKDFERAVQRRLHHKAAKYVVYLDPIDTVAPDGYAQRSGEYFGHVRGGPNKILSYEVQSSIWERPKYEKVRASSLAGAKVQILKKYPFAKFKK